MSPFPRFTEFDAAWPPDTDSYKGNIMRKSTQRLALFLTLILAFLSITATGIPSRA